MQWHWQVRRSILDAQGDEVGYGKGRIVGWLPASQSEFVNERTKRPAALWHVVFEEICEVHRRYPPSAMGEEDLEEHEVKEAALAFNEEKDPRSWYSSPCLQPVAKSRGYACFRA